MYMHYVKQLIWLCFWFLIISGWSPRVVQLSRASSHGRSTPGRDMCAGLLVLRSIEKRLVNIWGKAVSASVYTWTTSNVRNKVPNMAHTTKLCLSLGIWKVGWTGELLRVESSWARSEHLCGNHCGPAAGASSPSAWPAGYAGWVSWRNIRRHQHPSVGDRRSAQMTSWMRFFQRCWSPGWAYWLSSWLPSMNIQDQW